VLFVREGALYAQGFDPERIQLTGKPTIVDQRVVAPKGVGSVALSSSSDGRFVYRSGTLDGLRQLAWYDRSGKEIERVPGSHRSSGSTVALSRDGRWVAFDQLLGGTTDVWLFDLQRPVPTRFTSDPEFEVYPIWSPDGTRIAYMSNRRSAAGTMFDTYVKSVSGDGREDLLVGGDAGNAAQIPEDWSADGRFVLYTDTEKGVWAVRTDADKKPFPVVETVGFLSASGAQFSPDGEWIAYQSQESGQRTEVFVQRFPGPARKVQISTTGGVQVRWRRDGRELFYVSPDNRRVSVPTRLDSERDIAEPGTPVRLFSARFTGDPRAATSRQYAVSADGQRFLIDTVSEVALPMIVVLNWKPNP
jgi:Tol biopolymer transport system component